MTSYHITPQHIRSLRTKTPQDRTPEHTKIWIGNRPGWSPCVHSFYRQNLSLAYRFFPPETSAPGSPGNYWHSNARKNGGSVPRSRLFWTHASCSSLRSSDPEPSSWTSPTGTERPSKRINVDGWEKRFQPLYWMSFLGVNREDCTSCSWVDHSNHSSWNAFRSYFGLLSKSRSFQYH